MQLQTSNTKKDIKNSPTPKKWTRFHIEYCILNMAYELQLFCNVVDRRTQTYINEEIIKVKL